MKAKPETNSKISKALKTKFREILLKHPRGIFGREFISKFKASHGEDLNLEELGYYSLIDLVNDLPDVFSRTQPSECNSDWLLFDAESQIIQKLKPKDCDKKTEIFSVDYLESIISNTRKILQAYPDGIFIDEFIHVYSLNTEVELNIEELGYDSLTSFFMVIKSSVPLKFDYSNVRTKIRLAVDAFITTGTPTFPEIPKDAVAPGPAFELQKLPVVPKDNYFEIYVGYIVNPSSIHIQLKGMETSHALKRLTNDLENFYNSDISQQYIMQQQHIVVGAVCAAIWSFDNTWYRATITSVDMNYVVVIFNDFGNSGKISKDTLRYLKKEHLKLPAQAIKSRMAFVSPNSKDPKEPKNWSMEVRDRLVDLCIDKILMAKIVRSLLYPDIPSFWICDCNGVEDVNLNYLLVKEGLATYSNEPEKDSATTVLSSDEELMNVISTVSKYKNSVPQTNTTNNLNNLPPWFVNQLQLLLPNKPVNQPPSVMDPNLFMPIQGTNYAMPNYTIPNAYQNNRYNVNYPNFGYPPTPSYFNPPQVPIFPNVQNTAMSNLTINVPKQPPVSEFPSKIIDPPKATTDNWSKHKSLSTSPNTTAEEDNNESDEEILIDEDDDAFYEVCEQYGFVQRYVLRVKLQFGYKIHIIVVENVPYATSDEITQLFWPSECGSVLQRRLHQNNIVIETTTICKSDYEIIFKQLAVLNVKGIQENEDKTYVVLYQFSDLMRILNAFGHPSPTIRSEINQELQKFNLHDELWQYFTDLDLEDEEEIKDENNIDTDSSKFNRMCSYDLKASLEGVKFKKTKLERLGDSQREFEKLNKQCRKYEQRIKDIEELSHSLNMPD